MPRQTSGHFFFKRKIKIIYNEFNEKSETENNRHPWTDGLGKIKVSRKNR